MSDNMPKHTLGWGIAVSLIGALLVAFAPPVLFSSSSMASTQLGQTFLSVVFVVLDLVRELVLPLGTALIGASIVMFYLRARSGAPAPSDRPKRWVLPDPTDRRSDG